MNIRTRAEGDVQILDLEGSLRLGIDDLHLRETVKRLLEAGHPKIVLNLKELIRIDSAGLGEILGAKKAALTQGGDVKLMMPPKRIHEILLASQLTDVLSVYDSESDAVRSF